MPDICWRRASRCSLRIPAWHGRAAGQHHHLRCGERGRATCTPGATGYFATGPSRGCTAWVNPWARQWRCKPWLPNPACARWWRNALSPPSGRLLYDRLSTPAFPPHFSLWPVIQAGYFYARVRYGVDLHLASPLAAVRATRVPVLLIHGTADTNIPHRAIPRNCIAALQPTGDYAMAGGRRHSRERPGEAIRELYKRRVTGWFRDHQ